MSAGLFTLSTSSSPLRAPTDSRRTIAVSTADDSADMEATEAIARSWTVWSHTRISGQCLIDGSTGERERMRKLRSTIPQSPREAPL